MGGEGGGGAEGGARAGRKIRSLDLSVSFHCVFEIVVVFVLCVVSYHCFSCCDQGSVFH